MGTTGVRSQISTISENAGGDGGIRTLGTGYYPYDGLANRWFQPLTHVSGSRRQARYNGGVVRWLRAPLRPFLTRPAAKARSPCRLFSLPL